MMVESSTRVSQWWTRTLNDYQHNVQPLLLFPGAHFSTLDQATGWLPCLRCRRLWTPEPEAPSEHTTIVEPIFSHHDTQKLRNQRTTDTAISDIQINMGPCNSKQLQAKCSCSDMWQSRLQSTTIEHHQETSSTITCPSPHQPANWPTKLTSTNQASFSTIKNEASTRSHWQSITIMNQLISTNYPSWSIINQLNSPLFHQLNHH